MPKEKVGKRHLSHSTEPHEGMPKKTKTIQPTITFLLKKKEIGDSSAKTSIDKGKPKHLERTKLESKQK
jgi:hypothetical protein